MSQNSEQPTLELTVVTLVFDARDADEASADRLMSVLSKYVVVSRGHPGCLNIDLCASVISPGRYLIIEKWESPEAQRAHFDSTDMVEMARACQGVLADKPDIDLYEGISAHDQR